LLPEEGYRGSPSTRFAEFEAVRVFPYPSWLSLVTWHPRQNVRESGSFVVVSPRLLHRWSLFSWVLLFAEPWTT
jgi:hypothetical protein